MKCPSEHTLFVKTGEKGLMLTVSLYVDDLIFTRNDRTMFAEFKESMKKQFDMTDLGKMNYFLGVEVQQNPAGIFISQSKYGKEILERFGMNNSRPVDNHVVPSYKLCKKGNGTEVDATTYKQIVGSLMYLTATRPDLMYVVCLISRYMEKPTDIHLQAAKRVLRYLQGTVDMGILYSKGGSEELIAYVDSDYAGDVDDRKNTSGYLFFLGT